MADNVILINGQEVKLIPLGKCACGCGGDTKQYAKNKFRKFIHGHNGSGSLHWDWKGGKSHTAHGYPTVRFRDRDHHRINQNRYVREHILIAEKILGKPLPPKAVVHHIDGDITNNKNNNLVICQDPAYHQLLHRRQRALKACGHANWRKCTRCKEYDDPINLIINKYGHVYHRRCENIYKMKRYWKSKMK